jgi:FKBP-type peptidyl-prolyl cis-trans isomerase FkpA/FKBP-type peptidyl-prolyl cis-trans isomerase FklB
MSSRIGTRIALALGLVALVAPLVARAQVAKTEDEKTVYALGVALAQSVKGFNLSPAEVKVLIAGINASLANEKPAFDVSEFPRDRMNALRESRMAARAAGEREASARFLAEAAAQKGAQKKVSGLIYLETKAGAGDAPTTSDKVKVEYTGKRRDGSVFDGSKEHGKPAEFPLGRVIACWTEGIQLMKPGGKAVLTCPADLAYGDTGFPPGSGDMIAPGAAMQFEIELVGVEKGAGVEPPPVPALTDP